LSATHRIIRYLYITFANNGVCIEYVFYFLISSWKR
jgi:hypothetical protein